MSKQKVLDLRPTQFAVGMLEVEEKIQMLQDFSKKQRRQYVDENPVPVVISPEGHMHIVDHHHFVCVCYHVGIGKVHIEVVHDFSKNKRKLTYKQFWKWMFKNRNAYPFCQFGEGPLKALYLPRDIRGLADDPYRSIAWFVRKSGGFASSDRNFAEFAWANYFRNFDLLDKYGPTGLPQALERAVKLAQKPQARKLPGYEKLQWKAESKAVKKAKREGKRIRKKME
jgi:hypothetical protein